MRKVLISALLVICAFGANAQESTPIVNNVKLSGYVITQYQYSGQKDAEANSFNLRMGRLILDGRILDDFFWRVQLQVNGNTSTLGASPRLVDMFAEWQKYDYLRVRMGQFKIPFTFENPAHPIDQGFYNLANSVLKLSHFSDRTGAIASNGRDVGLEVYGDFLKNNEGRTLLHYEVGVFNGQGISLKDVDQRKDIIGGLWVKPIEGLRIGVFGWEGSYARRGTWTEGGTPQTGLRSMAKHRYAISGEYMKDDWTLRSEYIHSTGYGFTTAYNKSEDAKEADINHAAGNKADGFYASAITPLVKEKLHAKARYDLYRPQATWGTAVNQYEVGLDYIFAKRFKIGGSYIFVNDRALAKHNYNMVDVQVSARF
jgi:phosphate-selective porin O and P superfamily protein